MSSQEATLDRATGEQSIREKWYEALLPVEQTSDTFLDAGWREKRQKNRGEGRALQSKHRKHFAERLASAEESLRSSTVADLLQFLAVDQGFAWVDIARLVGVSVPALRKWRLVENGASPANQLKIIRLVAFVQLLTEIGVPEPPVWFSLPFLPDYTVAPKNIFQGVSSDLLLEVAAGSNGATSLLDETYPDWRTRWKREYQTILNDAGEQVLVHYASTGDR